MRGAWFFITGEINCHLSHITLELLLLENRHGNLPLGQHARHTNLQLDCDPTRRSFRGPRSVQKILVYVCGPTTYQFVGIQKSLRGPVFFDVVQEGTSRAWISSADFSRFHRPQRQDHPGSRESRRGQEDAVAVSVGWIRAQEYSPISLADEDEPANYYPKVTCHIPEITAYIQRG